MGDKESICIPDPHNFYASGLPTNFLQGREFPSNSEKYLDTVAICPETNIWKGRDKNPFNINECGNYPLWENNYISR